MIFMIKCTKIHKFATKVSDSDREKNSAGKEKQQMSIRSLNQEKDGSTEEKKNKVFRK